MFSFFRVTGFVQFSQRLKAHVSRVELTNHRCPGLASRPGILAGFLVLISVLPLTVSAESCIPESQGITTTSKSNISTGVAEQRAFLDPETRQLESKAQLPEPDLQRLAQARTLQRQNIVVIDHPDGSKSADLGEAYLSTLQARIVDGELITCHERRGAGN